MRYKILNCWCVRQNLLDTFLVNWKSHRIFACIFIKIVALVNDHCTFHKYMKFKFIKKGLWLSATASARHEESLRCTES